MSLRSLLVVALLMLAAPLVAQRNTASLRGEVLDANGQPTPGAMVTALQTETGFSRSTPTNALGRYTLADVPLGTYTVRAELDGFRTGEVTGITLNVADAREVNFRLELGQVADVITVTSAPLDIATQGGEVVGLITGEQIRELPLNGRNFVQLTQLMPGVSTPEGFNTTNKGLLAGVDMSVSGGSVTGNQWTIDGANNNDVGSNRTILVYPSIDAIEEFKIHRNSYSAEFGGAGGAQVNLVTRGGTNELRGSVFYFRRDDSWNEKNFFLEQTNQDKEPLSRDDVGFTLGGPILRDKLHFFLSGEMNDEERGVVRTGFVPTQAERNGDFSGPRIPGCSPPIPVDPLTGSPFPGNVIPPDRLSDAGRSMLQLYPLPNVTPIGGGCNNWVEAVTTPIEWNQVNLRLDYNVTERARLMFRYTADDWQNGAPNAGAANGLWGDDPFPVVDSTWDQPGDSLVLQLNQTFGTDSVNTLTFTKSGNEIDITRGGHRPELNSQINSQIPTVFPNKTGGADRSHPVFWGSQGYGALWHIAPWNNEQDLVVLKDDYQQVFGKHWLRAGGSYSWNEKSELIGGASAFETPQFWGAAGINGWGANSGNILADFLIRDMTHGFAEVSFQPAPELHWDDYELYIADSWQVTPRVNLDLGVRYSRFEWPFANDNRLTAFAPERFDPALGNDPCNGLAQVPGTDPCGEAGFLGGVTGPGRGLVDDDTDNFAPRLGMAWDIRGTGNSVLRAGFGQFYQRERVGLQLELAGNPPFAFSQAGIRKLDDAAEPCGGCFALSSGIPRVGIDPELETPYTMQYNLTYEQRVGARSTIEISYVGSRGRHLLRRSDINQVPFGDANGNGIPDRLEYVRLEGNDGAQAQLRPFPQFGDVSILYWESNGTSEYDSLQTQFITRFGRGSQFQASYTRANFEADDPLTDSGAGAFPGQITDRDNQELDWGYAGLHRDHVFNASLILQLATFEGRGGFWEHFLGDWQVGGIMFYSTGQALTVFNGSIPTVNNASGTGFGQNQRPLRVPGVSCSGSGDLQVINPAAYTLDGFQLGTIGNARRGDCEGPDFFQVDLSLYKNIRITDRVRGQLRFEVFNVTNRDNFLAVGTSLNSTSVTLDAPLAEATQIISAEFPNNFGQATRVRDPRQIQLGFKLLF
ncbi:MAG TPA: carboxypeptidase regulatory-like domain-containing protein [Thermoanaerobaculia bacterium]|nr:carboxypeptidase regulatory-like domain-containing protein [Thermoanaerobaculia bacterium]